MAQFSLETLLILIVTVVCPAETSPPGIVGGGYNTRQYPVIVNSGNSRLLNSALSDLSSLIRGAHGNQRESREDQDSNEEAEDNNSPSYTGSDNQFINVRLPPSVFSGMDRVNPFIRNKRQACQMTNGLTRNMRQMVSRLNSTMFLGHMPQQSPGPRISDPANQPTECPPNNDMLSSSTEDRLGSNCPWKLTRRDLGANSYPRHVAEAVCMCSECIGSAVNSCQTLNAPVTYFALHSCQDGMALMVKKVEMVAVGCFCVSPSRNSAADIPSRASINTINDY